MRNLVTISTATAGQPAFSKWKVSSALPGALASGKYVLYAYAYDKAGNVKAASIAITAP